MTRRSVNVEVLPPWFSLKKYKAAAHLDDAGWYELLTVRRECSFFIPKSFMGIDEEFDALHRIARKALGMMRVNPIIDSQSLEGWIPDAKLYELRTALPKYSLAIHSMTVSEFFKIDLKFDREKRQLTRELIGNPEKCFTSDAVSWVNDDVKDHSSHELAVGALTVNLNYPDVILKNQFDIWLRSQRSALGGKARRASFQTHQPKEWIRMGLLPCLDLLIWGLELGKDVTNATLAEALSSKEEGLTEDTVRKGTRALAQAILDVSPRGEALLERLHTKAATSLVESKNRKRRYKKRNEV